MLFEMKQKYVVSFKDLYIVWILTGHNSDTHLRHIIMPIETQWAERLGQIPLWSVFLYKHLF